MPPPFRFKMYCVDCLVAHGEKVDAEYSFDGISLCEMCLMARYRRMLPGVIGHEHD